ncbi:hypothetical protein E2C01_055663 [Portunus trituberculatus]|uniref:Uncharacterized protein n=1 Tax=Portunus trituberculatus TaxID=210409 RepID=A0A5B7GVM1_PORTR|nr:hypothetical protein [Portunus trituberculatus]
MNLYNKISSVKHKVVGGRCLAAAWRDALGGEAAPRPGGGGEGRPGAHCGWRGRASGGLPPRRPRPSHTPRQHLNIYVYI